MTGLVFLKIDEPWMLRMTMVLFSNISRSIRFGSPTSWIISFLTIVLACAWLTGRNLFVVSSLWRDLTMYLVLIDADIVGFEIEFKLLLRPDAVLVCRLLLLSSKALPRALPPPYPPIDGY